MGMGRTASGGSGWSGGVGGGVESVFEGVDQHVNRGLPVIIGGFDQVQPLQPVEHAGMVDSCEEKQNKCFNGCSRTCFSAHRLRWTPELHKQFVDAVNLLGGANEATPRAILNMMEVQGLTLYHIKSHLQKYRNGKTEVRLWRKPFIPLPSSYYTTGYKRDTSFHSSTFDIDRSHRDYGINSMKANTNGSLHQHVEPQATFKDLEVAKESASAGSPKEAGLVVSSESAASELLPSTQSGGIDIQSHHSLDFFDFLVRGKQKSVAPRLADDSSVDDFLNSVGCSTEFDIAGFPESGRSSVGFGTFFDQVATFSNLDDNGLSPYGSVFAADF